ncbi:MAG: LytR/AlgR family response regulator transcription factor [Ruminiclostridium sp.]
MLHFVILDDDATHNINTNKRLQLIFKKHELEASIALNTTDPMQVIEYCSRNNTRNNVYLLDINVQSTITGIDIAGIIREQEVKAYIIFVSAHPEYVMPSLKTKIFDYLIKPVSIDTLESCVNSIYKDFIKVNDKISQTINIKSGFNMYNLKLDEIAFLEKYGHLLVVHTVSGKIESSESLESIEQKLDKKKFFRCHKSYIVSISYISRVDYPNSIIYLKNGDECAVSKRCKKELKLICNII